MSIYQMQGWLLVIPIEDSRMEFVGKIQVKLYADPSHPA